jgi:hypothetical protein
MVRIAQSQARSLFTVTSSGLFIDTPLQGASSLVQCQSFGNKKTNKVDSSFKTFPHEVLKTYLKQKVGTESSISHRFFSFPVCCCFLLFTIHDHTKSSLWIHIVQEPSMVTQLVKNCGTTATCPPWCLSKRQQASTGVTQVFWSLDYPLMRYGLARHMLNLGLPCYMWTSSVQKKLMLNCLLFLALFNDRFPCVECRHANLDHSPKQVAWEKDRYNILFDLGCK